MAETIADIVAELRARSDSAFPHDVETMNMLGELADRIEDAMHVDDVNRDAMLAIHDEVRKYLAHEITETSMLLGIKNIVNDALSEDDSKADVCQSKKMSLDEAISHAEECVNDTPCGQNHRQLAEWLKELREVKSWHGRDNSAVWKVLFHIRESIQEKMASSPCSVTEHEYAIMNLCHRTFAENEPSAHLWNMEVMHQALEKLLHGDYKDRCEVTQIAHAALSASDRNCDRYECKSDAEVGFVEQTGEEDSNPLYWQLFANWLFATATEKGNEDGR